MNAHPAAWQARKIKKLNSGQLELRAGLQRQRSSLHITRLSRTARVPSLKAVGRISYTRVHDADPCAPNFEFDAGPRHAPNFDAGAPPCPRFDARVCSLTNRHTRCYSSTPKPHTRTHPTHLLLHGSWLLSGCYSPSDSGSSLAILRLGAVALYSSSPASSPSEERVSLHIRELQGKAVGAGGGSASASAFATPSSSVSSTAHLRDGVEPSSGRKQACWHASRAGVGESTRVCAAGDAHRTEPVALRHMR